MEYHSALFSVIHYVFGDVREERAVSLVALLTLKNVALLRYDTQA